MYFTTRLLIQSRFLNFAFVLHFSQFDSFDSVKNFILQQTPHNIPGYIHIVHVIFHITPHDADVHVMLHHGDTCNNPNNQQKIISWVEYIVTGTVRKGRTNSACSKG